MIKAQRKIWSRACFSHPLQGTLVIVHGRPFNRIWEPLNGARNAGSEA